MDSSALTPALVHGAGATSSPERAGFRRRPAARPSADAHYARSWPGHRASGWFPERSGRFHQREVDHVPLGRGCHEAVGGLRMPAAVGAQARAVACDGRPASARVRGANPHRHEARACPPAGLGSCMIEQAAGPGSVRRPPEPSCVHVVEGVCSGFGGRRPAVCSAVHVGHVPRPGAAGARAALSWSISQMTLEAGPPNAWSYRRSTFAVVAQSELEQGRCHHCDSEEAPSPRSRIRRQPGDALCRWGSHFVHMAPPMQPHVLCGSSSTLCRRSLRCRYGGFFQSEGLHAQQRVVAGLPRSQAGGAQMRVAQHARVAGEKST